MTLKTQREEMLARLLNDPMEALYELLDEAEESSLTIARESGVAGSVIRSIRQRGVGDVKSRTWAPLVLWALRKHHPQLYPHLDEAEQAA